MTKNWGIPHFRRNPSFGSSDWRCASCEVCSSASPVGITSWYLPDQKASITKNLREFFKNLFKHDLGSCQIHQIFVILKPMCIPWVKAKLSKVFKNSHRFTTRCFWSWMIWTRGSRAGLQRGVRKLGTMAQCPQFMAMLIEKTNGFWTPKCLDHVLGASSFHTSWFFQHCRLHAQPGSCSRQLAGFPAAKQRRGTQASRESIWAQVLQSHA